MLTFVGPYSQCLSVAGISLFRQAPAGSRRLSQSMISRFFPCISGISRLFFCLGRGIINSVPYASISNTVKGLKICRTRKRDEILSLLSSNRMRSRDDGLEKAVQGS